MKKKIVRRIIIEEIEEYEENDPITPIVPETSKSLTCLPTTTALAEQEVRTVDFNQLIARARYRY